MTKEKWHSMTDEQKTSYMRNVFKALHIGESFDYSECRKNYERMTGLGMGTHVYKNPCLVLELFDPVMTPVIMSWMYLNFSDDGNVVEPHLNGPAPLFGYYITELTFDKSSLMNFSDTEKQILREAIRIIEDKTKKEETE